MAMPLGLSLVRDTLPVQVVQRALCVQACYFFGRERFRRLIDHDSRAIFRFRWNGCPKSAAGLSFQLDLERL